MKYDVWAADRQKATVLECGIRVLKSEFPGVNNPFSLKMWMPKATKPLAYYAFKTDEQREQYIQRVVTNYENAQADKMLRKLERQGVGVDISSAVKVGDIFNFSWGYDQTNQDFYQVLEISGRQIKLAELKQESAGNNCGGSMSCDVVPLKDQFTGKEPFYKLLQFSSGKPYIKMASYGWCDLWDGKPQYKSWYA